MVILRKVCMQCYVRTYGRTHVRVAFGSRASCARDPPRGTPRKGPRSSWNWRRARRASPAAARSGTQSWGGPRPHARRPAPRPPALAAATPGRRGRRLRLGLLPHPGRAVRRRGAAARCGRGRVLTAGDGPPQHGLPRQEPECGRARRRGPPAGVLVAGLDARRLLQRPCDAAAVQRGALLRLLRQRPVCSGRGRQGEPLV